MTPSPPSAKPRLFRITALAGNLPTRTLHLYAHDRTSALYAARELLGPNGQWLRVSPEGEWS
jgi:hypothetical protein